MKINSIFGILLSSGVPFINRQYGSKTIPFTFIGSLGSLYQYSKKSKENIRLSEFRSNNLCVRFRAYDSILLVHVTDSSLLTSSYVSSVLDAINISVIACVGLNRLKNTDNADVLKTALVHISSIIGNMVNQPKVLALSESYPLPVAMFSRNIKFLQHKFNRYLSALETGYGFVVSDGTLSYAPDEWNDLPDIESFILTLIGISICETFSEGQKIKKCTLVLPKSSPNQQFLLYVLNYQGIFFLSLCSTAIEDSHVLSALNDVFGNKTLPKKDFDSLSEMLKFDPIVLGLTGTKGIETIMYVAENSDERLIKLLLIYSLSNQYFIDVSLMEGSHVRMSISPRKTYICHIFKNKMITLSAVFKSSVPSFTAWAVLMDICEYFGVLSDKKSES